MKVLVVTSNGHLAKAAEAAIQAQGHSVQLLSSISHTWPNVAEDEPIALVIVGDSQGIGSPSFYARQKGIPFIACQEFPATREFDVQDGAILELSPRLLIQALRSDALNLQAAITWKSGEAARKLNEELERTCVPDHGGWRNKATGDWQRNVVSYADYIAGLRHSGKYPGNVVDDIPEPYFTRLAKLVVQDRVGNHAHIDRMEIDPEKGPVAYCGGGRMPDFNVTYRARHVRFLPA